MKFDPVNLNRKELYNWDKTEMPLGFVAAEDADYADLHNWLLRLDLLGVEQAGSTEPGQ